MQELLSYDLEEGSRENIERVKEQLATPDTPKETYMTSEFDLITDDSQQKYVNPDVSYIDQTYIPKNLQRIDSKYITDTKGNSRLE